MRASAASSETRSSSRPESAELAALLGGEHGAVGVEQHVGAAVLQVADHARQVLHQHRLADAVQDHARDVGHLVDDAREQLPAHVGLRLEVRVGARAGGAQQVAAVGGLQVEADRIARPPSGSWRARPPRDTGADRSAAHAHEIAPAGRVVGICAAAPARRAARAATVASVNSGDAAS